MFFNVINALIVTNMISRQHTIESSYTCEVCSESFHNREELYDQTKEYVKEYLIEHLPEQY